MNCSNIPLYRVFVNQSLNHMDNNNYKGDHLCTSATLCKRSISRRRCCVLFRRYFGIFKVAIKIWPRARRFTAAICPERGPGIPTGARSLLSPSFSPFCGRAFIAARIILRNTLKTLNRRRCSSCTTCTTNDGTALILCLSELELERNRNRNENATNLIRIE